MKEKFCWQDIRLVPIGILIIFLLMQCGGGGRSRSPLCTQDDNVRITNPQDSDLFCEGEPLYFSLSGESCSLPSSWEEHWTAYPNGGIPVSLGVGSRIYADTLSAGDYTIRAEIHDSSGPLFSLSPIHITVADEDISIASPADPGPYCQGDAITFSLNGGNCSLGYADVIWKTTAQDLLGHGTTIIVDDFVPGSHWVVVEAQNSTGTFASDGPVSVRVIPSSCDDIALTQPTESSFLLSTEVTFAVGGTLTCFGLINWEVDGSVVDTSNTPTYSTSNLTVGEHTISAILGSQDPCVLSTNVSILDCPASCSDEIELTEPSEVFYLLGEEVPYALGGNTLCIESVVWDLNDESQILTTGLSGTLIGLEAGGYTITADVKSALLATCQKAFSFTVLPCPSSCDQYSWTSPIEDEFFDGDPVSFTLAAAGEATFDCADNILWESDIDGILDSGPALNNITVSDLTPATHTITASIVSSFLTTCEFTKAVTIVDCPGDCSDITFDLPTEGTFNYGNEITFALGGDLECVQNVHWSSNADGTLGSGATMTSLSTNALSITTHTITAAVKSYGLGTCQKSKQVEILPYMGSNYFPDTGQTTCYDNTHALQASSCPAQGDTFYGQDASYINPPPALSQSANGDSTVTDNITGLIWQQEYNGGYAYSWQDAADACSVLSIAGTTGWRLPTRRELMGITDFGKQYPALNTNVFDILYGLELYWTSTSNAAAGSYAWYVDSATGRLSSAMKDLSDGIFYEMYSRCVLGDPLPSASLTNNSDSTVSDSVTNLMWQDGYGAEGNTTLTWEDALAYCENLSLAAHTDWKLPDIRELESLVDTSTVSPAIEAGSFTDQDAIDGIYWSSTTASLAQDAWTIDFSSGGVGTGTKTSVDYKRHVRCVRLP